MKTMDETWQSRKEKYGIFQNLCFFFSKDNVVLVFF